MQHEHQHLPVTALAIFKRVILSGEGNHLHAYNRDTSLHLKSISIFESQAVHGIVLTEEYNAVSNALIWGGSLIRPLLLHLSDDGDLDVSLGKVQHAGDWILDAAFAPAAQPFAAIVTAHNALSFARIHLNDGLPLLSLDHFVSGSNSILYSAHVTWLSPSHCLIASGTAFGHIIVWSAVLSSENEETHAQSQTHYNFPAHEGSVFGVRLSPKLNKRGLKCDRVLASCSDDRTIRIWDVSDLSVQIPTLAQAQPDTGFRSQAGRDAQAPECMAKTMGHLSRVWHVRYLHREPADEVLRILSFGEDASVIAWALKADGKAYTLSEVDTVTAHSGKNLWSVAIDDHSELLATGGADGAIALHGGFPYNDCTTEIPRALLNEPECGDNYRVYSFVDSNVLISTTDQGRVVLIRHPCQNGEIMVEEISQPLPGLRGYSVVASVSEVAFIAGSDGSVYAYRHRHKSLSKFAQTKGKIAGLFPCRYSESRFNQDIIVNKQGATTTGSYIEQTTVESHDGIKVEFPSVAVGGRPESSDAVALLITTVGAANADLLILEDIINAPDSQLSCERRVSLSLDPGFIITSFAFHVENKHDYAVLGSRNGSIAVYSCSASGPTEPLTCSMCRSLVHSRDAVTALQWLHEGVPSESESWLYSTGRDGTFTIQRIHLSNCEVRLELVHQLSLPFGPNIEGLSVSPQGGVQVWGFRSKQFILYDPIAQSEVRVLECGGAHRNWAVQSNDKGGTFVWTKASRLFWSTQLALPYRLLNSGGHGREIKAIAISCLAQGRIIATGSEDTNIKLFKDDKGRLNCIQTLKRHNTGIQHLQWSSNGQYLFSSGGFEEFFVWKITANIPCIGVGVLCESTHPRSGKSDLRIMGFDVFNRRDVIGSGHEEFIISMAYSDSTLKLWTYTDQTWDLLATADYLTSCLTHVLWVDKDKHTLVTAATDGHLALWRYDHAQRALRWTQRYKVHQSAIHRLVRINDIGDGSSIIITGGDDNAIGITRLTGSQKIRTLLIPRAHAAAVTGLAVIPSAEREGRFWLASAGIDQRIKLWEVRIDVAQSGVDSVEVKRVHDAFTPVADVSGLQVFQPGDGDVGLVICGVGMDFLRLPRAQALYGG